MRKLFILFLFFLSITFSISATNLKIMVNTGHIGAVNTLLYHEKESLLFSGGEDGTVRVWNISNKKPVHVLRVSHLPVKKLAIDPAGSKVAVITRRDVGTFYLSVWDWKEEKKLYSRNLSEQPLYLSYSPKGSFLVYSITRWQSLTFLDGNTGEELDFLREGFGIVTAFLISSSENTIMTYSPSGTIQYWDIRTGQRKTFIQTQAGLTDLHFTGNLRYMAGTDGKELFLVDLVDGSVKASYPLPGIRAISINPENDKIACYYLTDEGPAVAVMTLYGNFLYKKEIAFREESSLLDILYHSNIIYTSHENGSIITYNEYLQGKEIFSTSWLAGITDVSFTDNNMVLSMPERIVTISSELLDPEMREVNTSYPTLVNMIINPNPIGGKTGIKPFWDGRIVLWGKEKENAGFTLMDPITGEFDEIVKLSSSIISLDISFNQILILQEDGSSIIFDPYTGKTVFRYSYFGLKNAIFFKGRIVAGKSRTSGLDTPLLQINPKTGETVPFKDSNLFTYFIIDDSKEERFYSIGIERKNQKLSTILKQHSISNSSLQYLESQETLLEYAGEDLSAWAIPDPDSNAVYSSLGFEGVKKIINGNIIKFTDSGNIPRKLLIHSSYLFSLNRDSTISVWNKETGEKLLNIYLFNDLNWVAIPERSGYYSSPDGEKHLTLYLYGNLYSGDPKRFKLN
ncbi:MAG: hypothetical protein DRP87_09525 [Spirochaetes bacterium]|nr:MAG: hypothetical protein DRP87_09525 [Spirochaetota bacterium]